MKKIAEWAEEIYQSEKLKEEETIECNERNRATNSVTRDLVFFIGT